MTLQTVKQKKNIKHQKTLNKTSNPDRHTHDYHGVMDMAQ